MSSSFQRHRIAKIHGNGESAGKIHPTTCWYQHTTAPTSPERQLLDLGQTSRNSLSTDQRSAYLPTGICTLWSSENNNRRCRCFKQWYRSSSLTNPRRWNKKTCILNLKIPHWHRTKIRSDRKRSTRNKTGMRTIQWLHPGSSVHRGNWPQASSTTSDHNRTVQDASQNSTFSLEAHALQPRSCLCTRQKSNHCGRFVKSSS